MSESEPPPLSESNWRKAQAISSSDPLGSPKAGTSLQAIARKFPAQATSGIQTIRNWDAFDGVLLQMHFHDDTAVRVLGSAVMVAPGIALAAWHVLEPEISAIQERRSAVMLSGFSRDDTLTLWVPIDVTFHPDSDIVILSLRCASALPNGNVIQMGFLSTRIPPIGERVMLCGFRPQESSFPCLEKNTLQIKGAVHVTSGAVSQHFLDGRDKFLIRWPSIQVDCHTLGSMSGGPVFDSAGYLIGLLATGVDTPEQTGPSYVSLVWPVLPRRFSPVWLPGAFGTTTSLLSMAGKGCFLERPEALTAMSDETTIYAPWSIRSP